MSSIAASAVLARSYEDDAFVQEVLTNPRSALSAYDLSDAERDAFISGDEDAVLDAAGRKHEANYVIVNFSTP